MNRNRNMCLLSLVTFSFLALVHMEESSHHIVKRWADFPNVTFNFDCTDRPIGFYADLEFDCMIFHMCDEDGRRIPYMCANETSFNQKFRVCDWNYNVDCASSPDWYYLNDLTYRTDPPKSSTEQYNVRRKKSKGSFREESEEAHHHTNKEEEKVENVEEEEDLFDLIVPY